MGIDQVNQAMAQIDRVTQQNAALVEEAAAAADSLEDQAARLMSAVVEFKLDGAPPSLPPAESESRPEPQKPARPAGLLDWFKPAPALQAAIRPPALPTNIPPAIK